MTDVAVTVEIIRRNKEKAARPVTKDWENENLRMTDRNVTLKSEGLEASQYASTKGTDRTPPVYAQSTT